MQPTKIVFFPETYRCCGAEITFDLGYMVWQDNDQLSDNYAVPDTWLVLHFNLNK
jgi:hypothetical protein